MKKPILFLMLLFFLVSVMAFTGEVTSFEGQSNPFNISLQKGITQIYNISIPRYAFINNITINLSTYIYPILSFIDFSQGYNDSANSSRIWNSRNITYIAGYDGNAVKMIGKNSYINTGRFSYEADRTVNFWIYMPDNHTDAVLSGQYLSSTSRHNVFRLDGGASNVLGWGEGANYIGNIKNNYVNRWVMITIVNNGTFFSYYVNGINFNNLSRTVDYVGSVYWWWGNGEQTGKMGLNNTLFDELSIWRSPMSSAQVQDLYTNNITDSLIQKFENPDYAYYVKIGDYHNDSFIGKSFYANQTIINLFNEILSNDCNCTKCKIQSNNCIIPIEFMADYSGELEIDLEKLNYSYGIDNCSNSFGIPSNATAYNISFFDQISDVPFATDFNGKLDYLGHSYTFSGKDRTALSFCIYPSFFNNSVSGYIYYGQDGYTTKYHAIDSTYFNDITQSLDLYMINISGGNIGNLIVQVYDDFYNYISGSNTKLLEYDSDTDSFIQVSQCYTDTNGECIFKVELGTKFYIVQSSKVIDGILYSVQSTDAGQLINLDNTIIELHLRTSQKYQAPEYYSLTIVPYNTTLVGNTSYLTAVFDDGSNANHTVCIGYYIKNNDYEFILDKNCVSGSSGIVNSGGGYTLNRSYDYVAKIFTQSGNSYNTTWFEYHYNALEGTIFSEWDYYLKPFILFLVLCLLAVSIYLKNINIFAIGMIPLSLLSLRWYPGLMGGVSVTIIIVINLTILYFTKKKNEIQ